MLKLEMIGRLTRDPESRTFQKGETDGKVCNFTVAASVGYGQYKHTEYVKIVAWNGLGRTCMEYLRKGSRVFVSGTPAFNVYTTRDGNAAGNIELTLDEIEFLSSKDKTTEDTDPIATEEETEDVDDLL